MVPDITNPFFGKFMRGAQAAAWNAGYTVAVVDIANDPEWQLASVQALRAGPVDGFLFFTMEPPRPVREPTVVIEATPDDLRWVCLDSQAGSDAALGHLLELGHRRIGHVASAIAGATFVIREERWRAALRSAGVEPSEELRASADFDLGQAMEATLRLLDGPEPPTALFCDDDVLAGGAYLAARERGLRIPGDVSIVGFDDVDYARLLEPPLTTVRADAERLGAAAFEALAATIAGEDPGPNEIQPVELIVRGSTGPPAGATPGPRRPAR